MISATDPVLPHALRIEGQQVLDDLNLPMLFLETARVEAVPSVKVGDPPAHEVRSLRIRVLARRSLTPANTAALLCRVLHNHRIPSVEIDRIAEGVRLRCSYLLPTGSWRLDITAPIE
jgi:hypothetical protein